MKFLIPTLSGNEYANLITALAVIIAVEYTPGAYDIWDGFVGLLAIGLGYSFIKKAKEKNDFWYSFISASLISLGIVNIISFIFFGIVYFIGTDYYEQSPREKFIIELFRFLIFVVIALRVWYNCMRNKA